MVLPYKKLSEEEDAMRNILEKGEYPFSVKAIAQKPTKSGEYLMLEVELAVLDQNGKEVNVRDWIVFMDEMAWKFRHFAATCDLLSLYNEDKLEAQHFMGKNGVVKVTIREYEKDGEIKKVNSVVDYIKPGCAKGIVPVNDFINDDIPL